MLRRLGIEVDAPRRGRGGLTLAARMPVAADLCDEAGAVRAGIVATLVDVVGGALSVRTAAPDWAVTADLSVRLLAHRFPLVDGEAGVLEARGSVVRAGRRSVVLDVDLDPVAHATMSFAVMARSAVNRFTVTDDAEARGAHFAWPAGVPTVPYFEHVGLTARDGVVTAPLADDVGNSFGALQGGMVATLADAAAALAGGGRTVALDAYYLGLGRIGPFRAAGTRLGPGAVRVEVRDTGADDRLMTVALAGVEPAAA
jgi:acyl-coenzyme A thioesterase PaaI-like protein